MKGGVIIISVSQVGKLKCREVKSQAQCHTASQWQSQDLNPYSLATDRAQVLNQPLFQTIPRHKLLECSGPVGLFTAFSLLARLSPPAFVKCIYLN